MYGLVYKGGQVATACNPNSPVDGATIVERSAMNVNGTRILTTSSIVVAALSAASTLAFQQPLHTSGADGALDAQAESVMARFDGHKVIRAWIESEEELELVHFLSDDIWNDTYGIGGPLDFRITPEMYDILVGSGLPFEVMIDDVQVLIDAERADDGFENPAEDPFFNDYQRLSDVVAYMNTLANLRPDLAEVVDIGDTVRGRDIFALRITGPNFEPTRPGLLIHGGQHAREWITVSANCYIADTLIRQYDTDPYIKDLVDTREWWIIPVMNPDGYEYTWTNYRLWRKNRRSSYGVDLNRNWGYHWGGPGSSDSTNRETYRGDAPFSEPETQAMRDLCLDHPNIVGHIDIHSYSQLILYPWGWTRYLPPYNDTFDAISSEMDQRIEALYGTIWRYGPVYTTIYPASGVSSDWTFGDRRIWGFAFELRDRGQYGFVLPKSQLLPASKEAREGVFVLAEQELEPLMVLDVGWLERGQPAEFKVTRATPGSDVYFFYSIRGDDEQTFWPDLNVTLDIESPLMAATATADASGTAILNRTMPNLRALIVIWLQAAEYGRTTNVVLTQIN